MHACELALSRLPLEPTRGPRQRTHQEVSGEFMMSWSALSTAKARGSRCRRRCLPAARPGG